MSDSGKGDVWYLLLNDYLVVDYWILKIGY